METVDILSRAVMILERELGKGAALAQMQQTMPGVLDSLRALVNAAKIRSADTVKLTALLQSQQEAANDDHEDDMMLGAPDPAAYKSKSGGIVDTIKSLLEDSEAELADSRKKEMTSKHNYELLKVELDDAIAFSNKQLDKAKKAKAEAAEVKGVAEGDLAVTMKGLSESSNQLASIHHDCMTKAEEFEITTQDRGAELKALAQAKKIIIEATGGAASLTQTAAAFLQLSSSSSSQAHAELVNQEAVKFVRDLAYKLHSPALTQLAQRLQAAARYAARYGTRQGEDPFAKVKELVKVMIEKLLKEAQQEAAQKGFCDKEMSETKMKKDDLGDDIEKLTTKIDKWTAESAKLKDEVKTLQKELADLAESQAEMSKIRGEENGEYKANKAEMEQGLEGIKLALKVLREYYGDASKSGAGGGIISMLEVIEADFTKGLEGMITEEDSAAAMYKEQTQANDISKTTKRQDVKYKTKEAEQLDNSIAEATSDRGGLETELKAVLEYYDSIKKQCIAKPESYEDRKKRREAEIAGLKEALEILSGGAVFLQNSQLRGVSRHL